MVQYGNDKETMFQYFESALIDKFVQKANLKITSLPMKREEQKAVIIKQNEHNKLKDKMASFLKRASVLALLR